MLHPPLAASNVKCIDYLFFQLTNPTLQCSEPQEVFAHPSSRQWLLRMYSLLFVCHPIHLLFRTSDSFQVDASSNTECHLLASMVTMQLPTPFEEKAQVSMLMLPLLLKLSSKSPDTLD